jgi:hypothetical protein
VHSPPLLLLTSSGDAATSLHGCTSCNTTPPLCLKEIDQLVSEWKPVPLVPEDGLSAVKIRTPVVDSFPRVRITVDGKPDILNFASYNFWGLGGNSLSQVCAGSDRQHANNSFQFWDV